MPINQNINPILLNNHRYEKKRQLKEDGTVILVKDRSEDNKE